MNTIQPSTMVEARQAVRQSRRVIVRGCGTKPVLSRNDDADAVTLDMTSLNGMIEYEPQEYTFTALAGTPLREIDRMLAENGQYLPFDPPLVERGATLGGTVAAGLSGAGRLRYGGVRDFILGIRFIDGTGSLIHGGGKVVKNAAGFDLPKLFIGSLGTLGAIVEVSFKVFPRPRAYATVCAQCRDMNDAISVMHRLTRQSWDLDSLDLLPPGTLMLRIAGEIEAIDARTQRLTEAIGGRFEVWHDAKDQAHWSQASEFAWMETGRMLVRVPTTPNKITALDSQLDNSGAQCRYSVAGNLAWIGWPADRPIDQLDQLLRSQSLSGLALLGSVERARLGVDPGRKMALRVKQAMDPDRRFTDL